MRNKEILIDGFNNGELPMSLADEFAEDGYYFVCNDGVLVDILLDKEVLYV